MARTKGRPPGRVALSLLTDRPVEVSLRTRADRCALAGDRLPTSVDLALPTEPESVINSVGGVLYEGWLGGDRGYLELDRGQYDEPAEVFSWSGAAVLLRDDDHHVVPVQRLLGEVRADRLLPTGRPLEVPLVPDTRRYLLQVVRMVLSYNPLRVFMPVGLALLAVAVGKLVYDSIDKDFRLAANTLLIFFAGFQTVTIGLIADLISRATKPSVQVPAAVGIVEERAGVTRAAWRRPARRRRSATSTTSTTRRTRSSAG